MSITPSLPVEPSASFNLIVDGLGAISLDHLVRPRLAILDFGFSILDPGSFDNSICSS
jgi:hypothetical protein